MTLQPTDTTFPQQPLPDTTGRGETKVYRGLAKVAGWAYSKGTREAWDDADQLPQSGPVIVAANHVSYVDVLATGRYLIWHGRWPRYLGKSELWKIPVISWLARGCRQIPVYRGTTQAKDALRDAFEALDNGECIAIYPEGGRTKDPDLWPQTARTGVGRLAITSRAPVIPVAHWGTHEVMPGTRVTIPRLGREIRIVMGDPVDLGDLYDAPDARAAAREATERIMAAITAMVEELRGEKAPEKIWNPRKGIRQDRPTA